MCEFLKMFQEERYFTDVKKKVTKDVKEESIRNKNRQQYGGLHSTILIIK
ncbi:hypothetical protein U0070_010987, partial [Myodes glareolus]